MHIFGHRSNPFSGGETPQETFRTLANYEGTHKDTKEPVCVMEEDCLVRLDEKGQNILVEDFWEGLKMEEVRKKSKKKKAEENKCVQIGKVNCVWDSRQF